MEKYKLAAIKSSLTPQQILNFQEIVIDKMKELEPVIRACYHKYLDHDGDALAWIVAIDGLFLLDILRGYGHVMSSWNLTRDAVLCRDVMVLENQIPVILLKEIRKNLQLNSVHDADDLELFLMLRGVEGVADVQGGRVFGQVEMGKGDKDKEGEARGEDYGRFGGEFCGSSEELNMNPTNEANEFSNQEQGRSNQTPRSYSRGGFVRGRGGNGNERGGFGKGRGRGKNHFDRNRNGEDRGCSNHMATNNNAFLDMDNTFKSHMKLTKGALVEAKGKGIIDVQTNEGNEEEGDDEMNKEEISGLDHQ
ncbi:hypothetical protein RJ639_025370, partial [Escallonia herrerae]